MRLGLLKNEYIGQYPKFVWVSNLDSNLYHDVTSIYSLKTLSKKIGLSPKDLKNSLADLVTEQGGYSNLTHKQKNIIISEDVEIDRSQGDGKILFTGDKEYVIYQEGPIDFSFDDTDFDLEGTEICCRLYCNGADVLIGGYAISDVNTYFRQGQSSFVILHNDAILQPGFINYFTFNHVNHNGIEEIRVSINVIRETPTGGASSAMSDWRSFTYYKIGNDVIGPDGRLYNCLVGHTSTVWDEDLANNYWERQGSVDDADFGEFLDGFGTPTATLSNDSEADSEVSSEGGN